MREIAGWGCGCDRESLEGDAWPGLPAPAMPMAIALPTTRAGTPPCATKLRAKIGVRRKTGPEDGAGSIDSLAASLAVFPRARRVAPRPRHSRRILGHRP